MVVSREDAHAALTLSFPHIHARHLEHTDNVRTQILFMSAPLKTQIPVDTVKGGVVGGGKAGSGLLVCFFYLSLSLTPAFS